MDSEKLLFEKGCFLPSWTEDIQEETPLSNICKGRQKDLATLLDELADIKKHIEDVKKRQRNLAKALEFYNHNFVRE